MKHSSDPREEEGPAQPPRLLQFLPHSGSFPTKHGANFPSRLLRTRQAASRLRSPRDRAAGWAPTPLNFFWRANQQSWQGECLCTMPLLKDWKTKTVERVAQRTSLPLQTVALCKAELMKMLKFLCSLAQLNTRHL